MAIGATSLLLVIICVATLTTIALYSSPYQAGEPFVPLTGRLISDVTVDGITRLCHDGDDACLLTGLSDATPDDANQIVYLKDIPTVAGGKELSKFRNGCGMSHSTNAMGDIVLSPLITAGNGLSTVPGCGEGDPIILEVNVSDVTLQLNVSHFSAAYITDKCAITHSYNSGTNSIEFGALIAGNGGITVGACPDGGAQQLGLNGTAVVDTLDSAHFHGRYIAGLCGLMTAMNGDVIEFALELDGIDGVRILDTMCGDNAPLVIGLNGTAVVETLDLKHLVETFFADVCGITYDYDSTGDQIFSTLQFVGLDGVMIDVNCSIPGGPIEISLNGTVLVETINISYFSETKLVATCGLEQVYDSMLDAIVVGLNLTSSDGVVLGQPCADDAALNIGLNGTALVDTLDMQYFSTSSLATECGLSQVYNVMSEQIILSLDLFSMDNSLLFNYSCDTGQLSICVNESRILQNVNASEVLNVLFEPGCGLMLDFIPPNDMIRFSTNLSGTNGIIIDPSCGVGEAQIISLDSEGVVDTINITYFNELYINPLCGLTSTVNNDMIELGLNVTGSGGIIVDAPCGGNSALNIALDSEGVVDTLNITYFNELYMNPLCGLTSVVNNDMIELSLDVTGSNGVRVDAPCGNNSALNIGLDGDGLVETINITYFNDLYISPLCGLTSVVNSGMIELALDVTGSDGILVDAPCGPNAALNIGLNGTAVVDSLDVNYLIETLFADACGITYDYDSIGNQIFTTLQFVGFDGVTIDTNCSIPGGAIEISLNGTLLVETLNTSYFSDNKLFAECGITQVYDVMNDGIILSTDIAGVGGVFVDPSCPLGVQTISLDPNTAVDALNVSHVYESWFGNGCGVTTDLSMGVIYNNLDLINTDGAITIGGCAPGTPVELSLPTVITSFGGTGLITAPTGNLLMGNGGVWSLFPPGAATYVLTSTGPTSPLTWTVNTVGTVTGVSATAPLAINGPAAVPNVYITPAGTVNYVLTTTGVGVVGWAAAQSGVTSVGVTSPITIAGTLTSPVIGLGTVPVFNGGTGITSYLTNGHLPVSSGGGSAMTALAPGTLAQVLTVTATNTLGWRTPTTGTVTSVSALSPLSVTMGTETTTPQIVLGTVPVTKGGTGLTSVGIAESLLISAGPTSPMSVLPPSVPGYVLTMTGTSAVAWLAPEVGDCNLTCPANYYMHLENGNLGYGISMGYNHTFADDTSHAFSGILSGSSNGIINAMASVVTGGKYNLINDTFCGYIGAGLLNYVSAGRSAIIIGEYNSITGSGNASIIGAGKYNTITDGVSSGIFIGYDNNIVTGVNSIIVGGSYNALTDAIDSIICAGNNNTITVTESGFIGAGELNALSGSINSAILVGSQNSITDATNAVIVAGSTNTIALSLSSLVGSGEGNSIVSSPYSGIVAGINNVISGGIGICFIGAGTGNAVDAFHSAVVAGSQNTLSGSGPYKFIGAGQLNLIHNSVSGAIIAGQTNTITGSDFVFLGVGQSNTVEGGSTDSTIVAGRNNRITNSPLSFIGAGGDNTVLNSFGTSFIGAGSNNDILTTGASNAIVAGSNNVISGVGNAGFIGSGNLNTLASATYSAIVAGQNCRISSSTGAFVGSGEFNVLTDATYSSIVSGALNTITSSQQSMIGTGWTNTITASWSSMIGAGLSNTIESNSEFSSILSGQNNRISSSPQSIIGAGDTNVITTNSRASVIVGGTLNTVTSSSYSFIGAGAFNIMTASTVSNVNQNAIVAGINNIMIEADKSIIGSGNDNNITSSTRCAIVAGDTNSVTSASFVIIGSGVGNIVKFTSSSAIVTGSANLIDTGARNIFIGAGEANIINGTGHRRFIGAGYNNILTDSEDAAIVAGSTNTIFNSRNALIGSGSLCTITSSNNAAILIGTSSTISSAPGATILTGSSLTVTGAMYTNTAVAQNIQSRGGFYTSKVRIITSTPITVSPGDYAFISNAFTSTLVLGNSATIPDGMNIKLRDVGNAAANPITLSCVASSCIICPPLSSCTAAGGTYVFSTQYAAHSYIFSASTQTWYAM